MTTLAPSPHTSPPDDALVSGLRVRRGREITELVLAAAAGLVASVIGVVAILRGTRSRR